MKFLFQAIIFLIFIGHTVNVFGQNTTITGSVDTTKIYRIELHDGTIFIGNILHRDSTNIIFKTTSISKIEIPVIRIKTLEEIKQSNFNKGEYWFPNPNATRYLFGPSGYNIKANEGYYQNTYLFLNSVNIGVTDNFSIGGGLEFISTFGSIASGEFNPIFFITPKVGFEVDDMFQAGIGVLYASTPGFGSASRSSLGITYGIGTYGTMDDNVTLGLGWGFVEGKFSERPIITFSGMLRTSKSTALISENWLIPTDNYYGIFSYGIRFFGETIAFDLAFINNPDLVKILVIGIPYVNFVVKF